ncbi:hypothetical protein QBC32DRAFT_366305 [Pseudoneurospora amorphoporcata]|uniref:Uncharacterized protein n=1 Tax=Pseudoneurospora amorphoporcata TaxID=241081 RepID=A0AAN6NMZ6_9PEZI|nr:hypothetical protein QBC32DRAFT_366305 [Pseudoneurospora amorphoporcata]
MDFTRPDDDSPDQAPKRRRVEVPVQEERRREESPARRHHSTHPRVRSGPSYNGPSSTYNPMLGFRLRQAHSTPTTGQDISGPENTSQGSIFSTNHRDNSYRHQPNGPAVAFTGFIQGDSSPRDGSFSQPQSPAAFSGRLEEFEAWVRGGAWKKAFAEDVDLNSMPLPIHNYQFGGSAFQQVHQGEVHQQVNQQVNQEQINQHQVNQQKVNEQHVNLQQVNQQVSPQQAQLQQVQPPQAVPVIEAPQAAENPAGPQGQGMKICRKEGCDRPRLYQTNRSRFCQQHMDNSMPRSQQGELDQDATAREDMCSGCHGLRPRRAPGEQCWECFCKGRRRRQGCDGCPALKCPNRIVEGQ